MSAKKAILFDSTKCVGCGSCYNACKEKNHLPKTADDPLKDKLSMNTYTILQQKNGNYIRRMCMHCENPTCASVCPVGAFTKTPEGPVIYDSSKCMGCRYCMQACPFQIPTYEWNKAVPVVHKCIMCYDKVAKGEQTACAEACPTGATAFGFRDEMITEANKRIQESPNDYQKSVYGIKEVGGTSVLHLAKVSYQELGLPANPSPQALPKLTWNVLSETPNFALGWGAFLGGMWWLTNRKNELQAIELKNKKTIEVKAKVIDPIKQITSNSIKEIIKHHLKPSFWKIFCVIAILVGLVASVIRFTGGLGAGTNLVDEFPWGLWVGFKLCAVGLAAGGFSLCAITHIFNIKKFKPLVRPAVLIAYLGYMAFIVTLLFDLGQPWRIWHPMVMWNEHSVMFEVSWCVMLYTTVLTLEFSPVIFEKFGWHTPLKLIHMIEIPLVIAGVILSTLHQSSLGSMYLIVPGRLHPFWYSPLIPVFFFVSCLAAGCCMLIFVSYLTNRTYGKKFNLELLGDLAKSIVVIEIVYFVLRMQDLYRRDVISQLLTMNFEAGMFLAEIILGVILPIIIFSIPKVRRSAAGPFWTSIIAMLGFVLYRMNISITGLQAYAKVNYFPSFGEIAVTLMVVSGCFAAFSLAIQYLPVFDEEVKSKSVKDTLEFEKFTVAEMAR